MDGTPLFPFGRGGTDRYRVRDEGDRHVVLLDGWPIVAVARSANAGHVVVAVADLRSRREFPYVVDIPAGPLPSGRAAPVPVVAVLPGSAAAEILVAGTRVAAVEPEPDTDGVRTAVTIYDGVEAHSFEVRYRQLDVRLAPARQLEL